MSHVEDFPRIAGEAGWAVDVGAPDPFGEVRATAVGDAGTIKMLFGRDGKMIAAYLFDQRRRTYRTVRVGVLKDWLDTRPASALRVVR